MLSVAVRLARPLTLWLFFGLLGCSGVGGQSADSTDFYETGPRTRDGIGKYYMGREISQVMGHRGASWLERSSREREERTDLLLDYLASLAGETYADIGAGSGYFSVPLAQRLDAGSVLAVDIQPEMLSRIARRADEEGVENIELIRGEIDDPKLPMNSVDVVFLVDAYHEFSHPREMMQGIVNSLRDGGRVVLVEYRGEDESVPIKPLHKMTELQAVLELRAVGLEWQVTEDFLPQQHVMVFTKLGR
ncbi:MAG: class I SAM-dependent methyltransferase [Gemmatimonadota bacterium]|nr:MAG: class I SAM-dependent methyltransferase [Gemmatimonadota bacterium]